MFPDILRAASYHPRRKMPRNEHEKIPRRRNIQANARQIRKYTLHFSSSTDNSVMVRSKIKCMYEIRHIALCACGVTNLLLETTQKMAHGNYVRLIKLIEFLNNDEYCLAFTNTCYHLQ